MRRCVIPSGLRTLAEIYVTGFINIVSRNGRSYTSLGGLAKHTCKESDVSKCEERLFGESHILQNESGLHKSCDSFQFMEILRWIEQGRLQHSPSLYNSLLKKCAELGRVEEGRIVHAHILNSEFKDDISAHNNIILMYAKCGNLDEARKIFNEMPSKDVLTWTSMIIACSQNGWSMEALLLFPQMLSFGLKPDAFTFSSLLKASGAVSSSKNGMVIHACCIKYGCESNTYVGSSLVDMYTRCGHMDEARMIFDEILVKNSVSWNTLIAGHVRKDEGEKALSVFQRMKRENFEPNQFTYSSILSACANTGALEQGKWIHTHVIKSGMNLTNFVGHTLLHMYAKSGSIEDAEKVFSRLMNRDVVSWNTILSGYAQHGLGARALEKFENMLKSGIQPNGITFLCILTACSHAGLLEQGKFYFDMMKTYGLDPRIEHYVTLVDLLGRAGKLDEAMKFIRDLPIEPTAEVWKALLGACRMHKRADMGAYAFNRVFELDPHDSGPYIILSNIYASSGKKSEVVKVRKMMKENRARKEPACSWVEIENTVHIFISDGDSHPQIKEISQKWEEVKLKIKEIGYVPDTSQALLFVDEQERESVLQHHSEKLALAFAILNTPPGSTIRIKKNIRVCSDCHSAIKLASMAIDREIILRDTNRFHHFQSGSCSCGDYW